MSWALPMTRRIETQTPQGCILLILVRRQVPVWHNPVGFFTYSTRAQRIIEVRASRGSVMFESGFHRTYPIFSASEAAGRSLVEPQAVHLSSHRPFTRQAAGRSLDKPQAVHLERLQCLLSSRRRSCGRACRDVRFSYLQSPACSVNSLRKSPAIQNISVILHPAVNGGHCPGNCRWSTLFPENPGFTTCN